MARINTNIASVIAQSNFDKTQNELNLRLERLSTGLRINRGSDDPAGLIISERLRSNIQGVNQGIKNSERAGSVISTTEAALTEVNDLLNSIKSLVVEAANSGANSREERDANQLQIDSAIDSITRISNTASFGSLKLLNGSLDYKLSGVRASAISLARVTNASFLETDNLAVTVDVINSAQVGALYYNGNTTPAGVTLSAINLEVRGAKGVEVITISSGQSLANVAQAVNNLTSLTGVTAELINNNAASGLVFKSSGYGTDEYVSVKRLGGPTTGFWQTYKFNDDEPVVAGAPFPWAALTGPGGAMTTADNDIGRDVSALVNGNLAKGNGLEIQVNSGPLGMRLLLTEDLATLPGATPTEFRITGGGSQFQLGPDINALQQANMGIQSVAATNLGGTLTGGVVEFLSSIKSGQTNDIANSFQNRNFTTASNILDKAIDEISILRGRLGAFGKNVLDPNVRSLQSSFENLSSSESQIRDSDFAAETSKLTRAQILSSAGISTLALANQQSQSVLQLLG